MLCEATSLAPAPTGAKDMRGYLTDTSRHWCERYARLSHWHQPSLVRMLCEATSLAPAPTGAKDMRGYLTDQPPLVRMLCEATSLTPAATGANVMQGYLTDTSRYLNECTFGESTPLAPAATEVNMSFTGAFLTTTNQI